ncbi:MAG TPA: TolC family protein [Gemmatimonadaceae bacterium]|jgi:outer membrane protein|nr:TolC family protein [Gemmatimonadaceae bacterium]
MSRLSRIAAVVVFFDVHSLSAQVQSARVVTSLTLDEAVQIATQNNPGYLRTYNLQRSADAQVRSTMGALLPTSGASFGANYQQGGSNVVQGTEIKGPDTYSTSYNFSLNYFLSLGTLAAPSAARANRAATLANVNGARATLRGQVLQAYLNAVQSRVLAAVQDTLLQAAETQVELAQAKYAAGGATILDVRNAQVGVGLTRVGALNGANAAKRDILRLSQVIGVTLPPDVKLSTDFPTDAPPLDLASLIDRARRSNPTIVALRSTEQAAGRALSIAHFQYTPSLNLSSGYGKQALDHATFPFAFSKRPYNVSMFVSLPVFNGFQREQNTALARVTHDNAFLDLKERELQLTNDITDAFGALATAKEAMDLQAANSATARQVLEFAEERYRLGAGSFLDIATARTQFSQAELSRVAAVFDFHRAFATLETAVGDRLR